MATDVKDIVILVSQLYNDEITFSGYSITSDGDRVSGAKWLEYLNSAFKAIANARPDILVTTSNYALVTGSYQALPEDGVRLIDITRNKGVAGTTEGSPVTKADREDLEAVNPEWHSNVQASGIEVSAYCYDARYPRIFYIYPAITAPTYVELIYSFIYSVDAYDDHVYVSSNFDEALVDYMLYMAYSMDDDSVQNRELSIKYLNKFYQELGMQAQTALLGGAQDEV